MSKLEQIFGKTAQIKVLENLIGYGGNPTYLSGIAEETGLSHSSVARVIIPLVEIGVVNEKLMGGKMRIFEFNKENETSKLLVGMLSGLCGVEQNKG